MKKQTSHTEEGQNCPLTYSLHLKLKKQDEIFGPGIMQLLSNIEEDHSLNSACEKMNMAYSKGWRIIKTAEKQLGFPLLERKIGGVSGGGSELTPKARDLVERFSAFQTKVYHLADQAFQELFPQDQF